MTPDEWLAANALREERERQGRAKAERDAADADVGTVILAFAGLIADGKDPWLDGAPLRFTCVAKRDEVSQPLGEAVARRIAGELSVWGATAKPRSKRKGAPWEVLIPRPKASP